MLQIVECLEGDFLGFPEDLDQADQITDSLTASNEVWRRLRDSVTGVLGQISLEDMTKIPQHLNQILNYSI